MPLAATLSQNCAALTPNSGTPVNHSGGGGNLNDASEEPQSTIVSKLSVIVVMASQNGTTKTSKRASVMTATASPRTFHNRRWT